MYLFYVPVDADQTDVVMFVYGKASWRVASLLWPLVRGMMLHEFQREVRADVTLLANMADYSPRMEGMKLSRFDKILGLTPSASTASTEARLATGFALPVVENGASGLDALPAGSD